MEHSHRQFESMLAVARERLLRHAPEELAHRAAVSLVDGGIEMESFGRRVHVTLPDCAAAPTLDMWHTLTLLHYLDLADGTALSGRMMAFSQYQDGMVRGGGFDRYAEHTIRRQLGILPPHELRRRCLALGGEELPSNADLCVRFSFAPRYPLWLRLWYADEEFPASGRLFLDECAGHYLTVEDAVTVGELLLKQLTAEL